MRTELEIRHRIENIEYESGELLDKQSDTGNIVRLYELQDKRDELHRQAEQLRWVLNE